MYVMGRKIATVGTVAILTSTPAWSLTVTDGGRVNQWTWPPVIVIPLLLTAGLYVLGVTRMRRRNTNRRSFIWSTLCFVLGWISLILALDSPLHDLGEQLFWVHM